MSEDISKADCNQAIQSDTDTEYRPLFQYHASFKPLFRIVLLNTVLNILTLTLWRFWGTTRVRRYLWSQIEMDGDRFEYTGQARELVLGFILAALFLAIPVALYFSLPYFFYQLITAHLGFGFLFSIIFLINVTLGLMFYWMVGVARYRARAYRFSRTRWRGIRGGVDGSSVSYGTQSALWVIGLALTLGLVYPVMRMRLAEARWEGTRFGDRYFLFIGSAKPLYGAFLFAILVGFVLFVPMSLVIAALLPGSISDVGTKELTEWIVVPVMLASVGAIYWAKEFEVFARAIRFNHSRFHLEPTIAEVIGLYFGNLLIVVLTLGAGTAFATHRQFRFLAKNVRINKLPDFEALQQSALRSASHGEGLADAFGVSAIDIGA